MRSRPSLVVSGRAVRIGGVQLESLGSLAFAGRRVHLLRAGGVDVLVTARARDVAGRPAFVSTATTDVVYACWPEAPLPEGTLAALEQVGRALAAKRDASSEAADPWGGQRPEPSDVLRLLPPPNGLSVDVGPARAGGFAMIYDGPAGRVAWRVQPRRAGEAGVLHWAVACEGHAAATDDALAPAREHLLAVIAAVGSACGLGVSWASAEGPPFALKVSLAAPVDDAVVALRTLARGHRRLRLSLAVPSECECACVFCSRLARGPDPDPGPVLQRARALADAVRPFSEAGAVVGIVLVGNDALRFPALADLLAILAGVEPATFGVVTPGTTLADPAVARLLADAGLAPTLSFTLHGPDAVAHDRIAGLEGAFVRLRSAVANCRAAGLAVRLHHVVVGPTLEAVPATLALAATWCDHVRLVAFTSEPQHHARRLDEGGFLAAMIPPPRRVRALLAEHAAAIGDAVVALEGFPACLVPPSLTERLENGDLQRVDLPAEPPATCRSCRAFGAICPGPDRGTLAVYGESWLEAV